MVEFRLWATTTLYKIKKYILKSLNIIIPKKKNVDSTKSQFIKQVLFWGVL